MGFFSNSKSEAFRAGEIGSIDMMKNMAENEFGRDSFEAGMFAAFAESERKRFEEDFGDIR
ncbi:hypothetical protein [Streptomyces sp. HD]|uniref:hypothetical protein n=1 Tax=Streptomyces sp. HD TaxID=3020892 RepID=UPI00232E7795|nr:hypothetical protein [Streptomyces sp. HD]MDC0765680.1 hypothetical protein [Streptomyces sp. HD]